MPLSDYVRSVRERIGHDLLMLPAVSAVIRDELGRVLVARAAPEDPWSLIGGGVEPGEEPASAIAREIHEELGVAPSVGALIGSYGGEELVTTYPNGDVCAYVTTAYECRLGSNDLIVDAEELADARWFLPDELHELPLESFAARILADAGILGARVPIEDERGDRLVALERTTEHAAASAAIPCPLALVVVRSPRGVLYGLNRWRERWELPGGMIDAGETPREAAVRELKEETGVRIPTEALRYVGSAEFELRAPDRRELAAIFAADVEEIEASTSDELTAVAWVERGRALPGTAALDAAIAAWSTQ